MGLVSKVKTHRFLSIAAGALFMVQATAANAGQFTGQLYHSKAAEMEQTFAIGVQSTAKAKQVNRDIVILVDTSASQMGDHRELALTVLDSLVESLSEGDRVRLVAVDVTVEDLMNQFAAADSEDVRTGLATLNARVPLGVTNLLPALDHARNLLSDSRNGAICYIGDGMSRGRVISEEKMGELVSDLQKRQIAVSSFGVGPSIEFLMLGTLANFSGGVVKFDNEELTIADATRVGSELATAIKSEVAYPAEVSLSSADVLPNIALPVRSDRETIYLGRGKLPREVSLADGEQVELKTNKSIENVLSSAWDSAAASRGLKVAFAGSELLELQEEAVLKQVDRLGEQAERALDLKDHRTVDELSLTMNQLNPGNRHAQLLRSDSVRFELLNVAQSDDQSGDLLPPLNSEPALEEPVPAAEPDFTNEQPIPPVDGEIEEDVLAPRVGSQDLDLLLEGEELIRINEQRYSLEVERLIERSEDQMFLDPESVISEIKRAIAKVSAVSNIGPDVRDELVRRLKTQLAEAQNRIEAAEQLRIELENERTQLEARERAVDQLLRDEEELEAWMERIKSLLIEGIRGNDDAFEEAQAVATKALDGRPRNGAATAARIQSEAWTQLNLVYDLNNLRRDRWLAALEEVERSHVPFPDEPPIAYPPPEIWQALTRNREKWKQVSIFKQTPREQKIREELDRVYELDVQQLSLQEALNQIADQGGFQIVIHQSVKDSLGDLESFEVEQNYSGIQLRSILRLLLGPQQLTYAIKDEVMFILTEEEANNNTDFLQLKIYPVTDLVIPITTLGNGGGIGQGINGTQNGGIGVGGGGFGGGNFGGQGFSVPDLKNPNRPDLKKKALNR